MWRFLGLGQRLTCIAKHISFFLLIWILTGILYYNFSFITLIEILNTFKSLLRKRSPFHISFEIFEISEFAAFSYGCVVLYSPFKTWIKIQRNINFCVFPEGSWLCLFASQTFPQKWIQLIRLYPCFSLGFPIPYFLKNFRKRFNSCEIVRAGKSGPIPPSRNPASLSWWLLLQPSSSSSPASSS